MPDSAVRRATRRVGIRPSPRSGHGWLSPHIVDRATYVLQAMVGVFFAWVAWSRQWPWRWGLQKHSDDQLSRLLLSLAAGQLIALMCGYLEVIDKRSMMSFMSMQPWARCVTAIAIVIFIGYGKDGITRITGIYGY